VSDFVKVPAGPPIPLSVLALDLAVPVEGWAASLAAKGIQLQVDDIGRLAVARVDAKALIAEKAAGEARAREVAAQNERLAIERDREWRSRLPVGTPWYEMPPGVLPVVAMNQAALDERPRRTSVLQDALAHGETVMHILEPQPAFEDE
jgi:hypothetical protein